MKNWQHCSQKNLFKTIYKKETAESVTPVRVDSKKKEKKVEKVINKSAPAIAKSTVAKNKFKEKVKRTPESASLAKDSKKVEETLRKKRRDIMDKNVIEKDVDAEGKSTNITETETLSKIAEQNGLDPSILIAARENQHFGDSHEIQDPENRQTATYKEEAAFVAQKLSKAIKDTPNASAAEIKKVSLEASNEFLATQLKKQEMSDIQDSINLAKSRGEESEVKRLQELQRAMGARDLTKELNAIPPQDRAASINRFTNSGTGQFSAPPSSALSQVERNSQGRNFGRISNTSGVSGSPQRGYSKEAYKGNFAMNESFYNVEKIKATLSPDVQKAFEERAKLFDSKWHGALARLASNQPKAFTGKKPILLNNISASTVAIYYPADNAVTYDSVTNSSRGIGNGAGSNRSSIGSFANEAMSNGKYEARLSMRGVEPLKKTYSGSSQDAFGIDPAAMGNANAHARLIRIHDNGINRKGRAMRTAGCIGLNPKQAKKYQAACAQSGGGATESFVSKVG